MSTGSELKIFAVSMIRNDGDIIWPFLSQAASLFDGLLVADVQSTDGTREAMEAFRSTWPHLRIVSFLHQEKHQAAIVNCLTREAISAGADWIFYLDADEFLHVADRQALVHYLRAFPSEVMHMPWMNLVPSEYGTFAEFNISQSFWWSGRVQPYNKVAVSTSYFLRHPNFYVHEGSHHVSRNLMQHDVDWDENLGLALMHVPVRSADRLRYKISHALRTLDAKHNSQSGEGFHVRRIAELVNDGRACSGGLNVIAANYGVNDDRSSFLDVGRLGWPRKSLPDYVASRRPLADTACSAQETMRRDARMAWRPSSFPRGSVVQGEIAGEILTLLPQPLTGRTELVRGRYGRLDGRERCSRSLTLLQAVTGNLRAMALDVVFGSGREVSSAVPALAFLFGMVRPRRYVHLGAASGEIFLSAVRSAEQLRLGAQCVAVGAWDGDPRLCNDTGGDFATFRAALDANYPWQHLIQAHASEAVQLFEDGSVDMLYVGADVAARSGEGLLDDWLPKMTGCGAVVREACDPFPPCRSRPAGSEAVRILGLECLALEADSDIAELFAVLRTSGAKEIAEEILRSASERLSAERAVRAMRPELDELRSQTARLGVDVVRLQALLERIDGAFWGSRRKRSGGDHDDLLERVDTGFWQVKALASRQAAEIARLEQELRAGWSRRGADQQPRAPASLLSE